MSADPGARPTRSRTQPCDDEAFKRWLVENRWRAGQRRTLDAACDAWLAFPERPVREFLSRWQHRGRARLFADRVFRAVARRADAGWNKMPKLVYSVDGR